MFATPCGGNVPIELPRSAGLGPWVRGVGLAKLMHTFNGCIGPAGVNLQSECAGCAEIAGNTHLWNRRRKAKARKRKQLEGLLTIFISEVTWEGCWE